MEEEGGAGAPQEDPPATPKEQPGPFDPHDGNRLIFNNSGLHPCALEEQFADETSAEPSREKHAP